jgi:hypothetical protein
VQEKVRHALEEGEQRLVRNEEAVGSIPMRSIKFTLPDIEDPFPTIAASKKRKKRVAYVSHNAWDGIPGSRKPRVHCGTLTKPSERRKEPLRCRISRDSDSCWLPLLA